MENCKRKKFGSELWMSENCLDLVEATKPQQGTGEHELKSKVF